MLNILNLGIEFLQLLFLHFSLLLYELKLLMHLKQDSHQKIKNYLIFKIRNHFRKLS